MFYKIGVRKNFTIFIGKHLFWSQLYYKEIPTQVFSCEYCEIFKNTSFIEHLRWLLLELLFRELTLKTTCERA